MTALRVWRTAKPSMIGARVEPMSADDARFWQLHRAMRALPEGTRPERARSAKPIARGPAQAGGAQPTVFELLRRFLP